MRRTHAFTLPPAPPLPPPNAVTVVAGPPGSGKTTWVHAQRQHGDLVIDVDALYRALSGLAWYDKPVTLLPFVCAARDAVIARLLSPSTIRHAWVVMSGAKSTDRYRIRAARVVVLEVSAPECLRRIEADPRRANDVPQGPIIEAWWREYERDSRDEVLTGVGGVESLQSR